MVQPEGHALWSRAPSIGQYGGSPQKRDYADIGVVNATTDVSAAQYKRLTADSVAVARTVPLCIMRIVPTATTIVVSWCAPAWAQPDSYGGNPAVGASSQYPTVSHSSSDLVIQMPATPSDEYGATDACVANVCHVIEGASWDGNIVDGAITLTGWTSGVPILLEIY